MSSSLSSTIVAISSPPGVGGIAVVRLSGGESLAIAQRHLKLQPMPRHCQHLSFVVGNDVVDDVVATYYQAPHSYTGLDTIEVMCHGSVYVQQRILQAFVDSGAMLAEPGEFTRQAFLTGRLNLSQAEAVADLIDSTNQASHQLAISQLRGGYANALSQLRQQLVDLTALLELELDFSEEDVEFANRPQLHATIQAIMQQCTTLASTFQQGNAIKNGIPVAILGEPNVGKSTLLNALLGEDRAIVSDIAGTTRDTIEELLTLQGLAFRFVDTAGLRSTLDPVELQGIQRSYAAASQASVLLLLVDARQHATIDSQLLDLATHVDLSNKHLVLCLNKCDTMAVADKDDMQKHLDSLLSSPINAKSLCFLQCAFALGVGVDDICHRLAAIASPAIDILHRQQPVVTNMRHYQALSNVATALSQAQQSLNNSLSPDLVAIDLRDALYHLGTITGATTPNDILSSIFSRFCIGK